MHILPSPKSEISHLGQLDWLFYVITGYCWDAPAGLGQHYSCRCLGALWRKAISNTRVDPYMTCVSGGSHHVTHHVTSFKQCSKEVGRSATILFLCYWWVRLLMVMTWWRHRMETFSALLALCAGNSPVTGEFPSQRPVAWSFYTSFDLRLE